MPRPKPLEPPRDLTIPAPGSTTARDILSRAVGRLLAEVQHAGQGAALPADARADLAAFRRVAAIALVRSPGVLASALRRPAAGALLRCLRPARLAGLPAAALLAELQALLLLELAAAGALPEPFRLRRPPPRVTALPARALIALPHDATALRFESGRLTVERASGGSVALPLDDLVSDSAAPPGLRIERPYTAVAGEIVLALADNNPLALREAHPDKSGNAIDLGGRGAEAWADALRAALAPIERHLPDLRREMDLYVHQIVPVGFDATRHLSASYQEAIGTIYLSLHPSGMTMTEALIHEFSHNKLNALFEVDDVLENAFSPRYASPVRPDPRPLHGVLLAVHAFLPVARLYELMIDGGDPLAQSASFRARFARVCEINREGAEVVLQHARPTRVGRGLVEEIARWTEHYNRRRNRDIVAS